MAMTSGKQNFVIRLQRVMKQFEGMYGEWHSLNALFNGQNTDYTDNITDADLAEVTAFDGITQATLDETMQIVVVAMNAYSERIEHVSNMTKGL